MLQLSITELYQLFTVHRQVCTDSRNIQKNDIFFALKGPTFNGNQFAGMALDKGAIYAVVDDPTLPENPNFILVNDVLTTLQDLASYYRSLLTIPVIGITGSNGKTTTKELVHAVLSTTFKTSTTKGNLNNHIGVPLTILAIPPDAEIAVIEMGANHQKEIEGYCRYTRPTHGIITNCGKAHLEGFGGVEGVRKGKGELFDFIKSANGMVFVCADFPYFIEMVNLRGLKNVEWYGTQQPIQLYGEVLPHPTFLKVKILYPGENLEITTRLVGNYNLYNVLAAAAIGSYFKVSGSQITQAIGLYDPDNNRSQLKEIKGNYFILDAYNANPSSMGVAIENLASMQVDKKVLILGAMAELGEESIAEHQAIVDLIKKYNWEAVVLVGGDFVKVNHPFMFFENAELAGEWWAQKGVSGAHVLLKGSRSSTMEKVLRH